MDANPTLSPPQSDFRIPPQWEKYKIGHNNNGRNFRNAGLQCARARGVFPDILFTGVTSERSFFRVRSSGRPRGYLRSSFFGVGGSGRKPPRIRRPRRSSVRGSVEGRDVGVQGSSGACFRILGEGGWGQKTDTCATGTPAGGMRSAAARTRFVASRGGWGYRGRRKGRSGARSIFRRSLGNTFAENATAKSTSQVSFAAPPVDCVSKGCSFRGRRQWPQAISYPPTPRSGGRGGVAKLAVGSLANQS